MIARFTKKTVIVFFCCFKLWLLHNLKVDNLPALIIVKLIRMSGLVMRLYLDRNTFFFPKRLRIKPGLLGCLAKNIFLFCY